MTPDESYKSRFLSEAIAMLGNLNTQLEKIAGGDKSQETYFEAYRMAHSVKSSSRMVGYDKLGEIAEKMECLLEPFMDNKEGELAPEGLEFLVEGTNELSNLIDQLNLGFEPDIDSSIIKFEQLWEMLKSNQDGKKEMEISTPANELDSVVTDFFKIEAEEHLKVLNDGLLELEKNPKNNETIELIFRSAHTLKGAASSIGFKNVEVGSHAIEDALDLIRSGERPATAEMIDVLLTCVDALKEALSNETVNSKEAQNISRTIVELVQNMGVDTSNSPQTTQVFFKESKKAPESNVNVSVSKLDRLMNMSGELLVQRTSLEESAKDFTLIADNFKTTTRRLSNTHSELGKLRMMARSIQAMRIGTNNTHSKFAKDFDELEFDRYDELDQIIKVESEIISDLFENISQFESKINWLNQKTASLMQNVSQIQSSVISSRLIPVSQILDRLPRLVRDLAKSEGKLIKLDMDTGQAEIDIKIADKIYDPLIHIVRNAIHHGIELPEERLMLDKPREGIISIKASYQGNQVKVVVSNDGRPIDTVSVAEKAIKRGILTEEELAEMETDEINRLIMFPSISTQEAAEMVAGRGVGLDIVKTNIDQIGGKVEIHSDIEETSFTLLLPISLAISQGLVVEVGKEQFVIPLPAVSEVLTVNSDQIHNIGHELAIDIRGDLIPLVFLDSMLGLDCGIAQQKSFPAIIHQSADQRKAIAVSSIPGKSDMVIKSLPDDLRRISAYAGATIFGTGQVVLVLHLDGLYAMGKKQLHTPQSDLEKTEKHVLVVDDSLSMRKMLSIDLESNNFVVETASTGLEALDKLVNRAYDVMVLDIEMPEMDGYELMSILKEDSRQNKNLPILIITSRSGEKHRQKAFELGATAYLVKPYDKTIFLDTIGRLLREQ